MPDPRQLGTDRLEQLAIELESQLHVERVGDEPAVLHDRDGIAKLVALAVELVRVQAKAESTGGGGRNEAGVPAIANHDPLSISIALAKSLLAIGEAHRPRVAAATSVACGEPSLRAHPALHPLGH